MVDRDTPFSQDLFKIAVEDRVADVEKHCMKDHCPWGVDALEIDQLST